MVASYETDISVKHEFVTCVSVCVCVCVCVCVLSTNTVILISD